MTNLHDMIPTWTKQIANSKNIIELQLAVAAPGAIPTTNGAQAAGKIDPGLRKGAGRTSRRRHGKINRIGKRSNESTMTISQAGMQRRAAGNPKTKGNHGQLTRTAVTTREAAAGMTMEGAGILSSMPAVAAALVGAALGRSQTTAGLSPKEVSGVMTGKAAGSSLAARRATTGRTLSG